MQPKTLCIVKMVLLDRNIPVFFLFVLLFATITFQVVVRKFSFRRCATHLYDFYFILSTSRNCIFIEPHETFVCIQGGLLSLDKHISESPGNQQRKINHNGNNLKPTELDNCNAIKWFIDENSNERRTKN